MNNEYYQNSNYAAIVPQSIIDILKKEPAFKNGKIYEDALLFISHLKVQNHIYKDYVDRNPAISCHSNLLRAFFSSDNFERLVRKLIDMKIVERIGPYRSNISSYKYKLKDTYYFETSISYPFTYKGVIKKFDKIRDMAKKYHKSDYLNAQLDNLHCLFIEKEEAEQFIHEQIPNWQRENLNPKGAPINVFRRENYYFDSVNKIHNGFTHNMSVSKRNERLNSAITGFPKTLRKFLYVQNVASGKKIFNKIEIDGSNTQPLFICIYLENKGYKIEKEFKELCLNGTLYDAIAEDLNETRNWVKDMMMVCILYTRDNKINILKYGKCNEFNEEIKKFCSHFLEKYPIFFNSLLIEKQKLEKYVIDADCETAERNNPGGSELATRIQKLEAELWIHNLLKELPEDLFYVTIHDSIMIFDPTVKSIINTRNTILDVAERLHNIRLPLKFTFHNMDEEEKNRYLTEIDNNKYVPKPQNNVKDSSANSDCLKIMERIDTSYENPTSYQGTILNTDLIDSLIKRSNKYMDDKEIVIPKDI